MENKGDEIVIPLDFRQNDDPRGATDGWKNSVSAAVGLKNSLPGRLVGKWSGSRETAEHVRIDTRGRVGLCCAGWETRDARGETERRAVITTGDQVDSSAGKKRRRSGYKRVGKKRMIRWKLLYAERRVGERIPRTDYR